MASHRKVLIEGLTPDEILGLSDSDLSALVFTGGPVVFSAGSSEILGEFRIDDDCLTVELAHIDGGGEGVLLILWNLARRFALNRGLQRMDWIIHAVHCAKPNLKLRDVLKKRGFVITKLPSGADVYRLVEVIKSEKI